MHLPIALHLAGLGQPAQGLKADFLEPAGFALPYIMGQSPFRTYVSRVLLALVPQRADPDFSSGLFGYASHQHSSLKQS